MSNSELVLVDRSKYLHSYSEFDVDELLPDNPKFETLDDVLEEWKKIAISKFFLSNSQDEAFLSSNAMISQIKHWTTLKKRGPRSFTKFWEHKLFVCKDKTHQKIQAIALTKSLPEDKLYVENLVTHPCSLNSKLNPLSEQVRGAGSALMYHLVNHFLSTNLYTKIVLEAADGSEKFYEKLGFVHESAGCAQMYLTTAKVQQMLSHTKAV
jgi:hypothetical protein